MNKIFFMLVALTSSLTGFAAQYYAAVDGADDASCESRETAGSLKAALLKANSGSDNELILLKGTYKLNEIMTPTTLRSSPTAISVADGRGSLKIIGETDNPDDTILDGGGAVRAIYTNTTALELNNLTLQNCYASNNGYGGAIYIHYSAFKASNCNFLNNKASGGYGGAINNAFFKCDFNGCKFTGNECGGLYGWVISSKGVNLDSCFFDGKNQEVNGQLIYSVAMKNGQVTTGDGEIVVDNTRFCDINIPSHKDYLLLNAVEIDIKRSSFSRIYTQSTSGAIKPGSASPLNISDSIFENCDGSTAFLAVAGTVSNCKVIDCGKFLTTGFVVKNCLFDGGNYRKFSYNQVNYFYGCTIVNLESTTDAWNNIIGHGSTVVNCAFYNNSNLPEVKKTCNFTNTYYQVSSGIIGSNNGNHQIVEGENVGFKLEGDHPYQLKKNSILRGKGMALDGMESEKDLAGNKRLSEVGTVDVGAYQYVPIMGFSVIVH